MTITIRWFQAWGDEAGVIIIASGFLVTPSNITIVAYSIVASSWFSLPSQAFSLDKIEETYNIDLFLSLYQIIPPSELCAAFNIAIFAWLLGSRDFVIEPLSR